MKNINIKINENKNKYNKSNLNKYINNNFKDNNKYSKTKSIRKFSLLNFHIRVNSKATDLYYNANDL